MRRHRDWTVVTCRGVLERTPVRPAATLVEPPGSRITRHHSEPGSRVPCIFDPSFCVRHEHVGHAFATMERRNVDLFDFVVDDHHKSSDPALHYCDNGVVQLAAQPSSGTNLRDAPRLALGTRTRGGHRAIRDARSQRPSARLPVVLCAESPPSAVSSLVSNVGTVVGLHLHEVASGIGL